MDTLFIKTQDGSEREAVAALNNLLAKMRRPFRSGDAVGVKVHWGERGNDSHLPPVYAREIGFYPSEQED
jgi:hypothetical protein